MADGTRGGGLVSEDGWTWSSGPVRPGGGVAPDAVRIGDRYYVAYAVGGGGLSGGHASQVGRIDQLADGTYRLSPGKQSREGDTALVAIGTSAPTLTQFDPASDAGRWRFRTP